LGIELVTLCEWYSCEDGHSTGTLGPFDGARGEVRAATALPRREVPTAIAVSEGCHSRHPRTFRRRAQSSDYDLPDVSRERGHNCQRLSSWRRHGCPHGRDPSDRVYDCSLRHPPIPS